jgi:hypothetical protein
VAFPSFSRDGGSQFSHCCLSRGTVGWPGGGFLIAAHRQYVGLTPFF